MIGCITLADDDEAREFDSRNANKLARKEMGLDWMLRSASKTEKKVEEVGEALEKPQVEEVCFIVVSDISF